MYPENPRHRPLRSRTTHRKKRIALSLAAVLVIAAGTATLLWALRDETAPLANGEQNEVIMEDRGPQAQAVTSSHHLATDAGREILASGGSAADAAVAVAAVLSVVEPYYSSALGGGTWQLYYNAETGAVTSLDAVGPVGSRATLEDYRGRADTYGMHQAIVPGAWDGWMLWLREYGELDLAEVLEPAISIAREGYEVSSGMVYWLGLDEANIRQSSALSRAYLIDGQLARAGDTIYQRDMARTFEQLAEAYDGALDEGRDAATQAARDYYYRGPIAEAIVSYSDETGGYFTRDDFASFEAEIVDPISINYRGLDVYQNPPNSQGIAMLEGLNILEGYTFDGMDAEDPLVVHRQVEAVKLAFADRNTYVGDPDREAVPVETLLSDEYAADQRARINDTESLRWPIEDGINHRASHTTTFHVVDQDGNAAAVTTSLGGQLLMAGDTGIHMNERMSFMSLDPSNVNFMEAGATVRHTSNPYMVLRDGHPYILGGSTGVDRQPQAQMVQLMNVVDFGMSPEESIAQPRFISTAFPSSNYPYTAANQLQIESGFRQSTVDDLASRGHSVSRTGAFGVASMILLSEDGRTAQAASENREPESSSFVIPAEE